MLRPINSKGTYFIFEFLKLIGPIIQNYNNKNVKVLNLNIKGQVHEPKHISVRQLLFPLNLYPMLHGPPNMIKP